MPVVRIERVNPSRGRRDPVYRSAAGYVLGDPAAPTRRRRLRAFCKTVSTLRKPPTGLRSKAGT